MVGTKHVTKAEHLQHMINVLGSRYFDPLDMPDEVWKPLSTWKGQELKQTYQISNKGRIKDCNGNIVPGAIDPYGYHTVHFRPKYPNSAKNAFVHSAVLLTHVGPPPTTMHNPTTQHKDHNHLNNCIDNLEWMESTDNAREGKGIKIRIDDGTHIQEFDSSEAASIRYCNKAKGYIYDCIKLGVPVLNSHGQSVNISYLADTDSDWVNYTPTRITPRRWRTHCTVTDSIGIHEFNSLSKANAYLHQDTLYLRYCYEHNLPAYDKLTGEQVLFEILDQSTIDRWTKSGGN